MGGIIIIGDIMKIKDKKIILTGAGSGIGRELALQLIAMGAYVIGVDINKEGLEETSQLINNKRFFSYIVDVSSDVSIKDFYETYIIDHKKLDILINNAGIIQKFVSFNELDMNSINRVMDINFYGPLKLTKLFLPLILKSKEGNITNISSMGGFFPFPKQTVYGASKAALKLLTEGLYAELKNTNVHVMIVFPGAVNTNISKDLKTNEDFSNYKMLSASKAAHIIINGIEKNKFKLFVGTDSKLMNFMYKLNSKYAINLINKKMTH